MKTKIIVLVLIVIAVFGIFAFAAFGHRSDAGQIRSIVQNTAASVERHDVKGVLSYVSKDYRDEYGLKYDNLKMLVAQVLRDEKTFTAKAQVTNIKTYGDAAKINVQVTVNDSDGRAVYNRNIYVSLKKEDGRGLLFIPRKEWKIVSADNLGLENESEL